MSPVCGIFNLPSLIRGWGKGWNPYPQNVDKKNTSPSLKVYCRYIVVQCHCAVYSVPCALSVECTNIVNCQLYAQPDMEFGAYFTLTLLSRNSVTPKLNVYFNFLCQGKKDIFSLRYLINLYRHVLFKNKFSIGPQNTTNKKHFESASRREFTTNIVC